MGEVTRNLSAIESGDPSAAEQLLPLVYDALRKVAAARLAQENPGQMLEDQFYDARSDFRQPNFPNSSQVIP